MKTVLRGIAIVLLLTIIQEDNMETEAALTAAYKAAVRLQWDISKRLLVLKCCMKNCKTGDLCIPNEVKLRGCKCFTRDIRFKKGGKWRTYRR